MGDRSRATTRIRQRKGLALFEERKGVIAFHCESCCIPRHHLPITPSCIGVVGPTIIDIQTINNHYQDPVRTGHDGDWTCLPIRLRIRDSLSPLPSMILSHPSYNDTTLSSARSRLRQRLARSITTMLTPRRPIANRSSPSSTLPYRPGCASFRVNLDHSQTLFRRGPIASASPSPTQRTRFRRATP